jgi:hypothetical protein
MHTYDESGRYIRACYLSDIICGGERGEDASLLDYDVEYSISCGADCEQWYWPDVVYEYFGKAAPSDTDFICSPKEAQVRVYNYKPGNEECPREEMLVFPRSASKDCERYTSDDILLKCNFDCATVIGEQEISFEEFDCCCGYELPAKVSINELIGDDHAEPCTCHETSDGRYVMQNFGNIEKIPAEEYAMKNLNTCEDILEDTKYYLYTCPLADVTGTGDCEGFDSAGFPTTSEFVAVTSGSSVALLTSAAIIGNRIF